MRTGYMAIGIAAVVGVVPASFALDPGVPDHGTSAESGIEAQQRQTHQPLGNNTGISLEVPTGRVWVAPEFLDGEPVYIRRETVKQGMAIVEISTTPFTPELSEVNQLIGRPDQPAPW